MAYLEGGMHFINTPLDLRLFFNNTRLGGPRLPTREARSTLDRIKIHTRFPFHMCEKEQKYQSNSANFKWFDETCP